MDQPSSPPLIVIGLGNPLLGDDGVGWKVVEALNPLLARSGIETDLLAGGGLSLMERLIGYDRAVIVDAICSGAPVGSLIHLGVNDRPTQRSASAHDVDLPTALSLGRRVGAHLPPSEQITILAIEAEDVVSFGETLTPEVESAIPLATQAVLQLLGVEKECA